QALLDRYPKFLLHLLTRLWLFKYFMKRRMKKLAAESQKRRHLGDWVFTVIQGEGEEFDFGIDYAECGICKFFHAQGADEFTPYLCLLDFPKSKAFGLGLVRTMTIAEGAEKCDFRWKIGRETKQGWPSEVSDTK
ncbi:MAG: L-2-amino-thiazoline-4-carboxylic acid hydrolase, partial [Candidatus Bathyarchaeia archaeon]|nr:L-2-amino-thiazoline-4-carboxylic acid hydrolase [Candidatus Bathyarchaeia archaeon]